VTLGNALEFYDFLVFSFFALQIGHCFFPSGNPTVSLLSALATFGAGFLTRPLGAWVIGGLGDRLGRKPMLLLSFAMIGVASLGVALTPSYASIGVAAPLVVIMFRLIQGFALGGELGASTALLAEVAPPMRRGFFISLQYVGAFVAILVAGAIGTGLASVMDDAALTAWGWRLAMAIGALIVPIGLALRRSMPETLQAVVAAQAMPLFANYWRTAVVALLMLLAGTITTYVLNFMTTYARTTLAMPSSVAFGATIVIGTAGIVSAFAAGFASDRFGRKPIMIWSMAVSTASILPSFWLIIHAPSTTLFYLLIFQLRLTTQIAATAALISITEAFPPRIRSGALAVTYALAISVFGGTTQFVVAWLIQFTGNPLAPAWYMFGAALIGLVAMLFTRETAPIVRDLTILKNGPPVAQASSVP
jgi:MHS family citrate/tricarballylate:H+ symporter-like MFS transporter